MVRGAECFAGSRDWAVKIDSRRAIVEANVAKAADISNSSFLITGFVSLLGAEDAKRMGPEN